MSAPPRIMPGDRLADGPTVAKRYKIPNYVALVLRRITPDYGSQGRAIQVATEMLSRMNHPVRLMKRRAARAGIENPDESVGVTYKLLPRTVEIIDGLVGKYETRGGVFEAILEVLSRKKLCDKLGPKSG